MKTKLKRLLALFMVVLFVVPTFITTALPSEAYTAGYCYFYNNSNNFSWIYFKHNIRSSPYSTITAGIDTLSHALRGNYEGNYTKDCYLPVAIDAADGYWVSAWGTTDSANGTHYVHDFQDLNAVTNTFVEGVINVTQNAYSPSANFYPATNFLWNTWKRDIRLFYIFDKNTVSLNGGASNFIKVTSTESSLATATTTDPTKHFVGWSWNSDGSTLDYPVGTKFSVTQDVVKDHFLHIAYNGSDYTQTAGYDLNANYTDCGFLLYPVFRTTYNLTFNPGSGEIDSYATSPTTPTEDGKNVIYKIANGEKYNSVFSSLPVATRLGYYNNGWKTTIDGTVYYLGGSISGEGTTINITADYGQSSATTLDADWSKNHYTIIYDGNGSTSGNAPANNTNVRYNTKFTTAANTFSKTGYNFSCWKNDDTSITVDANTELSKATVNSLVGTATDGSTITLKAQWTPKQYTVTLDKNASDATAGTGSVTATYNAAMPSGASAPTRTGYTFAGYYDTDASSGGTQYYNASMASTHVWDKTSDTTLHARWTINSYTLTLDYNGGNISGATSGSVTLNHGTPYNITQKPVRENYKHIGWALPIDTSQINNDLYLPNDIDHMDFPLNSDGTADISGITGNITYYAIWMRLYNMTFDANGGKIDSYDSSLSTPSVTTSGGNTTKVTYTIGKQQPYNQVLASVPSASRNGYTFNGWLYGSSTTVDNTLINSQSFGANGNATAYAQWTRDDYTITYNLDGGSWNNFTPTTSYNVDSSTITLPSASNVSKTDYVLDHWEDGAGNTITEIPAGSTGNKTVVAVWRVNGYNVTYADYNNALSTVPSTVNGVTSVTLPTANQVSIKDGYGTLLGWVKSTSTINKTAGTIGTTVYAPGAVVPIAENTTFYAVVCFKVQLAIGPECWPYKSDPSYKAVTIETLYKFYGTDLVLPTTYAAISALGDINALCANTNSQAQDQRSFMEWNTAADWENSHHGTGTSYFDSYSENKNIKLLAMWGYPIVFDADGGYFAHVINGEYVPIETTDTTQYNAGNGKYYLSRYETYVADYGRSDNIANNPTARYLYVIPDGVNTPVNEQYPVAPVKGDNTMWLVSGKPTYLLVNSDASSMQYYGKIGRATVETADLDLTIPVSGGNTARHSSLNLEWSQFRLISDSHGHTSVHFYAAWEPAVVYHANGGTGSLTDHLTYSGNVYLYEYNSYSVKTGDAAGITYTGKHVTEWKDADNNVVEVGASLGGARSNSNQIDLYAQWADNTYKVVWKNYDGTVLQTDTGVVYGTVPIYTESTPTKAQDAQYTYSFAGWDKTVVAVSGKHNSTITYTATFTETLRTYTITWVNEGGAVLETDENVEYGTTPSYDGTTPTKDSTAQYDYTFDAWTPTVSAVTGDATYTATFTQTARTYTVTLNVNSGTINAGNVTSYTYGVGATLPTNVTRDGYTFDGWFDNSAFTGTAVTAIGTTETGNKEFWAKWTEALDSNLKFTGANLTLYNDFAIRFRVAASEIDGKYENVYATFGFNGVDNAVTINLNEATLDKGYYVFKFEDIAPNMMGEPVIAQLHGEQGGVKKDGSIRYYAIADYCYNILGTEKYKSLHNLHTLLVDILNYGSSAEVYTNKHATHYFGGSKTRDYTEKTVNSIDEFASYSGLATSTAPNKSSVAYGGKTGSAGTASIDGKQPILGDTVAIRFYISGTAPEGSTVKFYIPDLDGSARVWPKPLGSKSGDYYTVLFDDFNASHMDNKICVTVLDGSGNAISQTLEYSIATYYEVHKNDGDNLGTLVTNMMKYGDSAKRYVASPNV